MKYNEFSQFSKPALFNNLFIFVRSYVLRIEPIAGWVMLPHYMTLANKEATQYLVSTDVRWRKILPCLQSLVKIVSFQFEIVNHWFCNIFFCFFLSNPTPSTQISNQSFAPALSLWDYCLHTNAVFSRTRELKHWGGVPVCKLLWLQSVFSLFLFPYLREREIRG